MGNVFEGGGQRLYLSNGGTAVFVDVLTLAVSDLADAEWDYRFAALLALQDQQMMGRGGVGFDLEDVEWGASAAERARSKDFVLRSTALALTRHRWDELGYEPPFAPGYLRTFAAMVESFEPPETPSTEGVFPPLEERAVASCARHRVLSALPYWEGCFLCHRPE
ncbi:hypothetical protein [Streptomyces sp. NPDC046887]|uniref:hypothetical protein n=1 Tax=Streptomyces sp. NPDC046887 TaxID=3155472 RepID=UPI0034094E2F